MLRSRSIKGRKEIGDDGFRQVNNNELLNRWRSGGEVQRVIREQLDAVVRDKETMRRGFQG